MTSFVPETIYGIIFANYELIGCDRYGADIESFVLSVTGRIRDMMQASLLSTGN